MSKKTIRIIAAFLASIFIFLLLITGTYSWVSISQLAINNSLGGSDSNVILQKLEKDADGNATDVLIQGAEFYLYQMTDLNPIQIGGRYVTDSDGKIKVKLPPGNYFFLETHPGYSYTYDKDGNGDITKYYFTVTDQEGEMIEVQAYNRHVTGSLIISKTVENADGSALTEAQRSTQFAFTVTLTGLEDGPITVVIDNEEKEYEMIDSMISIDLRHGQKAIFDWLPVGVQYIVTETPVAYYRITSSNHQGIITQESRLASFINTYTPRLGSITITKTIDEDDLMIDPDKEFEFTAMIGDETHSFPLKHGESKTFDNILVGTEYSVTEDDYFADGYVSIPGNYIGLVTEAETVLPFVNVLDVDDIGSLTIGKTIIGPDPDLTKDFEFSVMLGDTIETITLKHGQSVVYKDIEPGTPYSVTEIKDDEYDTEFTAVTGVIAGNRDVEIIFINKKIDQAETSLTICKEVGNLPQEDEDLEFGFMLEVEGCEPEYFTLKAGETRTFIIPQGANYNICEINIPIGYALIKVEHGNGVTDQLTATATFINNRIERTMMNISGEKTWDLRGYNPELPQSIIIYLKNGDILVDTIVVTPDEQEKWMYSFEAPKYEFDGVTEIIYTIEEMPMESWRAEVDGYNIKNTYILPAILISPTVKKVIEGDEPIKAIVFQFQMTACDQAPLAVSAQDGSKVITIVGEGEKHFGEIIYTKAGNYLYTITEIAGNISGYTYDDSEYTFTVDVVEQGDEIVIRTHTIEKDGEPCEEAIFVNQYDESTDDIVIIYGIKTWDHGNLSLGKHPTSITVIVKANDKMVIQRVVTANNGWSWMFELDRFDEDGLEIVYTIDEHRVEGYKTIIDGYNLINIYNHDRPVNTGYDSNILKWVVLMVLSITFLSAAIIIRKKTKSKRR